MSSEIMLLVHFVVFILFTAGVIYAFMLGFRFGAASRQNQTGKMNEKAATAMSEEQPTITRRVRSA